MAQGVTGTLPHFNSNEDVLPYIIKNRHNLTMTEIREASDWALDPGFVQRDAIAQFVPTLARAQPHQIDDDDDNCLLWCGKPYETAETETETETTAGAHFPVALPCGHIVGASCLHEMLKESETCFRCGSTIFTRPAVPRLDDLGTEQLLQGLVNVGGVFIEEETISAGSGSVDVSYAAFCTWARGHCTDYQIYTYRLLADQLITQLELAHEETCSTRRS